MAIWYCTKKVITLPINPERETVSEKCEKFKPLIPNNTFKRCENCQHLGAL